MNDFNLEYLNFGHSQFGGVAEFFVKFLLFLTLWGNYQLLPNHNQKSNATVKIREKTATPPNRRGPNFLINVFGDTL